MSFPPSSPIDFITELYIGYFNRAPDPVGMNFWVQAMTPTSAGGGAGMTLAQVAADFATSSETLALYPFLTLPNLANASTFVTQVYANMLNRAPDAAGLTFWTNELTSGAITPGNLILDVEASVNLQSVATSADAQTLAAKGTVAENYVLSISTADVAYTHASAVAVMAPVSGLGNSPVSAAEVTAGEAITTAYITPPPPPGPPTFTLTDSAATIAEGQSETFHLATTGVPAGTLLAYTITGTGDAAGQTTSGNLTVDSGGNAVVTVGVPTNAVVGDSGTLSMALVNGNATSPTVTVTDSTPVPGSQTFTLTTAVDNFAGTPGNDTFNGTYSDGGIGGGNTFNLGDTLAGNGGTDTLNITPTIAIAGGAAATSLVDALWTDITGIQNVNVTTGAGAINITTGTNFNHAFAVGGVDLTMTSTGGAINIDMGTVPFTGAATLTTTSTGGAQTIVTGSGPATVTASSGAGAITVSGSDLLSVSATTTGAGAQTITSTAAGDVTVTATAASGTQTITVGNGNDTVDVSGSSNTALAHITVGSGSNTITLNAGHTVVDTLAFSAANGGSTTSFTTVTNALAADTITWANATSNATIDNEGAVGSIALGISGANTADGYNTFTNGGNTYVYEYTGTASTSELVALVGVHTITATTAHAVIA
jgi:hypothetical protein